MEDKVTGVMVYYYFICKRKLWYFCHQITMEESNENVQMGKLLDENSYARDDKHINIDDVINIDFIREKRELHEVKKSKAIDEAGIWQLKYYLYYLNKKGKIAHTKAFQSMTYNQDGTVTLVNNIIGNTQIVVCQYKDEKLKVISRLVTDNSGNTKKYLINDNEVTEKEYNKVVNSYKRDNDRYRTYSYNGAEYSGYEDVSHALSALETKIQQIEQAEAEK